MDTKELDRAHVFHSWSAQALIDPLVIERAEGSCFWDADGKRYLDFSSQLVNVNIGHQHPRWSRRSRSRQPGCARSALRSPTTPAVRPPGESPSAPRRPRRGLLHQRRR
jgi:hypothetical protein